jgi:hypothetical protein
MFLFRKGDAEMRSLSYTTLALTAALAAAPLTGAFASADDAAPGLPAAAAQIAPAKVILDQLGSVGDGINAALAGNVISQDQARTLRADVHGIRRDTMALASSDHGRIPEAQYHQLLGRLQGISYQVNPLTY